MFRTVLVLSVILLATAACTATVQPVPEQMPEAEATSPAEAEATPEPTAPSEETPPPQMEPVPEGGGAEIGLMLKDMLAQQLQVDGDLVTIVDVEAVDWPDACLGVSRPDVMCAQVITPGFRITLEANGDSYVYHTNQDGSFVQLAEAPEARTGEVILEWRQVTDFCQSALFGADGVAVGPCGGEMAQAYLVSEKRGAELTDFWNTYAPFETDTPAGMVIFHGQGQTEATPAEQRMIAEWARLAQEEALAGRTEPAYGRVIVWQRKGGVAGFCDGLTVYITGKAFAESCASGEFQTIGQRTLTADELATIYMWVDTYQPYELEQKDDVAADAMTIRLDFTGSGVEMAGETEQQLMLDFSANLFTELSQ